MRKGQNAACSCFDQKWKNSSSPFFWSSSDFRSSTVSSKFRVEETVEKRRSNIMNMAAPNKLSQSELNFAVFKSVWLLTLVIVYLMCFKQNKSFLKSSAKKSVRLDSSSVIFYLCTSLLGRAETNPPIIKLTWLEHLTRVSHTTKD